MVTVVIVGILGAIAIAGYSKYVLKTKTAEVRTNIDAIAKGQTVYFLEHKEFRSVYTCPTYTPNNTKRPFGTHSSWGDIGTPISAQTMVYFNYKGVGGKNNGAGVELQENNSGIDWNYNSLHSKTGSWGSPVEGVSQLCTELSFSEFLNASNTQPHYTWFLLLAFGNLTTDVGTGNIACTTFILLMDTNSNGQIRVNPVQSRNLGE